MGQEIATSHFQKNDFSAFETRLQAELALLGEWFRQGRFVPGVRKMGSELEAWLIDREYYPAPINEAFLERLNSPLVLPELSAFNVELNTSPQPMQDKALQTMEAELTQTWGRCREVAGTLDADLLMIGILPTVRQQDLVLANISARTRYRALNEQILRMRKGYPIKLDISGRETLEASHEDVMLEAATTSFQIHLMVAPKEAVRFFNASLILSAPMVAATANSPYLFGFDLWDETRIPLFEQAVSVRAPKSRWTDRVTFGSGYVQESLLECFEENIQRFPVLLPELMDENPETMSHLRLHNGTIWRWNRPLIGFSEDGRPHLRIEHRVVPAGPSTIDTVANAALYFGLVHMLGTQMTSPESLLTFEQARANFYTAAKQGLNAKIDWLHGESVSVQELLATELIPLARRGLEEQEFDPDDIDTYLGVMEARVRSWCNGAAWQRGWVDKHGLDLQALTAAYSEQQHAGKPVHEWEI